MSNPSMLVHKNGSVVMVWRGSHGLTTATAPTTRGPFKRVPLPPQPIDGEDMMAGGANGDATDASTIRVVDPHIMWLDEPSPGAYHVISTEGGHAWSLDARHWVLAPSSSGPCDMVGDNECFGPGAYNGSVEFAPGGLAHEWGTRECPKIVQKGGVGGAPILLSNAMQQLRGCGLCGSATVVQQIGDGETEPQNNESLLKMR